MTAIYSWTDERHRHALLWRLCGLLMLLAVLMSLLSGCTGVNTYPTMARAGDTVSVMIGGTEKARKDNINVTLSDSAGQTWDLKAQGLIRSVFNLRTDGVAYGRHYSSFNESYISWANGHEPVQTMLVTDLPTGLAAGQATLSINLPVNDNSSDGGNTFSVNLEIIPGAGTPDMFSRKSYIGDQPVDFSRLEPAPYAKVSFSGTSQIIGAASLVINFDSAVVNSDDLNVYIPEAIVRGGSFSSGPFGETQRMAYWHISAPGQLTVDLFAPQGIQARYLQVYIVHPTNLPGGIDLALDSATVFDVNGNTISNTPALAYLP